MKDVKDLTKNVPTLGAGMVIFSCIVVTAMFVPALVLGVLWAR